VSPVILLGWRADFCGIRLCMPAVGELVRCTDGAWMVRPTRHCPRGGLTPLMHLSAFPSPLFVNSLHAIVNHLEGRFELAGHAEEVG
jgi:hypothetical protein